MAPRTSNVMSRGEVILTTRRGPRSEPLYRAGSRASHTAISIPIDQLAAPRTAECSHLPARQLLSGSTMPFHRGGYRTSARRRWDESSALQQGRWRATVRPLIPPRPPPSFTLRAPPPGPSRGDRRYTVQARAPS